MKVNKNNDRSFQVGDLVRYMSRVVLIVDTDIDGPWVYGMELGETEVAKYKRHVLRELSP